MSRAGASLAVLVAATAAVVLAGPVAAPQEASAQVTIPITSTTTTEPPSTTTTTPTTTTSRPTTTTAPTTTTESATTTTAFEVPDTSPPPTFEPLDPQDPPDTTVTTVPVTEPPSSGPTPTRVDVTGFVSSAYALGSLATLAFAGVATGAATQARASTGTGRRFSTRPTGGDMSDQRQWRLWAGFGFLALAGIVALVGYLQLSTEPAVNRQLPYLASAGMATVVLAAIGGSLVVGEQLRTESDRVEQLEEAIRKLSDIVAGDVEQPARLRDGD